MNGDPFEKHWRRAVRRLLLVAAYWVLLAAVGVVLKFVLDYVMSVYGVPKPIRDSLTQIAFLYPIVLSVFALLTCIVDAVKFTKAVLMPPKDDDS